MKNSSPATMNIAFLHPVLDALLRRGRDRAELASQLSIPQEALFDPSVTLSANKAYTFLKWAAACMGDPNFTSRIGQYMATGGWAPLVPLMTEARTVSDFLQKFGQISSEQSRSVIYRLEVEGAVAVWQMKRPSGTSKDAVYADAVAVGFFVQILRSAAQNSWDPAQVIAILPDTSLIPRDLLPATSVMAGKTGLTLRFPSSYLAFGMPAMSPPVDLPNLRIPELQEKTLVDLVTQVLEQSIAEPSLGVTEIAAAIGLSKWKLQSLLSKQGESVSDIRDDVRRRQAIERVVNTTDTVGSISTDLGYTNSSNFTRAFRSWTGKSPSEVRQDL